MKIRHTHARIKAYVWRIKNLILGLKYFQLSNDFPSYGQCNGCGDKFDDIADDEWQ